MKEYLLNARKQRAEYIFARLKDTQATIKSVRLISKRPAEVVDSCKQVPMSDRNSISAILPQLKIREMVSKDEEKIYGSEKRSRTTKNTFDI